MSRIGRNPIPIPSGVSATIEGGEIAIKGPRGEMRWAWPRSLTVEQREGAIHVDRPDDAKKNRAYHGLAQRLISNMVTGVSTGFKRELEIQGVGYRAEVQGNTLVLQLGYSHDVRYEAPEGIKIATPNQTTIVVEGHDKQRVGQVAAEIRGFRPPEPYKGKGVRHAGERVRRKVGKKTI